MSWWYKHKNHAIVQITKEYDSTFEGIINFQIAGLGVPNILRNNVLKYNDRFHMHTLSGIHKVAVHKQTHMSYI